MDVPKKDNQNQNAKSKPELEKRHSLVSNPLQFSIFYENLHQTQHNGLDNLVSNEKNKKSNQNHKQEQEQEQEQEEQSKTKKSFSLNANLNLLEYADTTMSSTSISNELMIASLLKDKHSRTWIPDSEVSNCSRCRTDFTTLNRKHHCRLCGKIFCYQCTPYQKVIPEVWNQDNTRGPVRLCYLCSRQVEILNSLDYLIQIFSFVVPDMGMLGRMSSVCHTWNNLSSYIMGRIRNIQYKKVDEPWTQYERNLMWVNRDYFVGHSNWTVKFLSSIDYSSYHFHAYQYPKFKTIMAKFMANEEKYTKPKNWDEVWDKQDFTKKYKIPSPPLTTKKSLSLISLTWAMKTSPAFLVPMSVLTKDLKAHQPL